VVVAAAGLVACSVDGNPVDRRAASTTSRDVAVIARPGEREWVAVYAIEPSDSPARDQLIEAAALQGFESPAACWDGIPRRLGVSPDAYLLGVVAPSEDELSDLVERLPGDPVLSGEFVRVCPND
jgi:hypothetical protein